MKKRIKKKKMRICDFCSKKKETKEIYGDFQICNECKIYEVRSATIAASIEG